VDRPKWTTLRGGGARLEDAVSDLTGMPLRQTFRLRSAPSVERGLCTMPSCTPHCIHIQHPDYRNVDIRRPGKGTSNSQGTWTPLPQALAFQLRGDSLSILIGQLPENLVVRPTVLPTVGRTGVGGVLRSVRSSEPYGLP